MVLLVYYMVLFLLVILLLFLILVYIVIEGWIPIIFVVGTVAKSLHDSLLPTETLKTLGILAEFLQDTERCTFSPSARSKFTS